MDSTIPVYSERGAGWKYVLLGYYVRRWILVSIGSLQVYFDHMYLYFVSIFIVLMFHVLT